MSETNFITNNLIGFKLNTVIKIYIMRKHTSLPYPKVLVSGSFVAFLLPESFEVDTINKMRLLSCFQGITYYCYHSVSFNHIKVFLPRAVFGSLLLGDNNFNQSTSVQRNAYRH